MYHDFHNSLTVDSVLFDDKKAENRISSILGHHSPQLINAEFKIKNTGKNISQMNSNVFA